MPLVSDLLGYAVNKQPIEFNNTFDSILRDKINDRLDTARLDIAASIYKSSDEDDYVPEDEDEFNFDDDLDDLDLDDLDIDLEDNSDED